MPACELRAGLGANPRLSERGVSRPSSFELRCGCRREREGITKQYVGLSKRNAGGRGPPPNDKNEGEETARDWFSCSAHHLVTASTKMFSSQGASSPFRSSGQQSYAPQQQQAQQGFAQQQSSFGPGSSSSTQQPLQHSQNSQSLYGTPQYGAGNTWGAAGSSNSPGAFGQFGSSQQGQQFGRDGQSGGTPGMGEKPRYLPGFLSRGNVGVVSPRSLASHSRSPVC